MPLIRIKENDLTHLNSTIELAISILGAQNEDDINTYYSKEDWTDRIIHGGLLLTTYVDDKLAGFAMCYIREDANFHAWLVGVDPKYRGQGLWGKMFDRIYNYAKDKGFYYLTLNTYESRFPVMYKFVQTHGFECYKIDEIGDSVNGFIKKSFFRKKL